MTSPDLAPPCIYATGPFLVRSLLIVTRFIPRMLIPIPPLKLFSVLEKPWPPLKARNGTLRAFAYAICVGQPSDL